ncbi:DUF3592 domain-containing protein [Mycobacterium sp. 1274761.0]|uniref:DUF3592 domain-containing protein n=1 Tax=Mycobacterium sp. 1274761.0 TaxID=1834077 RepID=UPI0018D2C504|nr:DUF3592 domain-containing protein [Mycobacterium sp. 1274761.0]
MDSQIAAEAIVRSPEPGTYRGATVAGYPIVNNDGMIALTRRGLFFHSLTGKVIEVPVGDITGVREATTFNRAIKSGRQHLVVQTPSGEIAFYVRDNAAWIASLLTVCAPTNGAEGSADGFVGQPDLDAPDFIRRRRGSKAVLAVVFTSIGLVFALTAGISAAVVAKSISADHFAAGTVVDLSHAGKGYRPVVEFVPPGSGPVRFTNWLGSNPPSFYVGDHVPVRYSPDNPQDAVIDRFWHIWFLPTLFGLFAAPFLLLGITFGATKLAARRQIHRESESGEASGKDIPV